jgi:hypothetical protein
MIGFFQKTADLHSNRIPGPCRQFVRIACQGEIAFDGGMIRERDSRRIGGDHGLLVVMNSSRIYSD